MTSVELRREKHTQARLRSHASGLPKLQEGKVRLLYRLTITVHLFHSVFFWNPDSEGISLVSSREYLN
jgi:hypothetical protein